VTAFRATYRLQLGGGFGFAQARALVPYLRDLGVSHVYLPPSFQAREGSTHGYDVVDPTSISRELGGEAEFLALAAAVREAGMGIVLDIVPNHMAVDDANRYWADPELRARYFDIDPVTGRHRRFFDVDHLAGVRQEDPEVFAETHRLALRLVREGVVDGLRIDHPDGLADPAGYLRSLREGGAAHVWVEKILDPGEPLRDWPVEGTVGYEFLNDAAAVCIDPAGEAPLTALWHELAGDARPFSEWADEAKREQATTTFTPELERLARDAAAADLGDLVAAVSGLPVYRTYVEPWSGLVTEADREATAALPGPLREVLALERRGFDAFVTRFQQTTPPIMAKGVEDTAFYRYLRLLALNDVGGDPGRFGVSVADFHAGNAERAARFPRNLLVSQTHDTKRSGDVRARLGALSWIAEEWVAAVRRWLALLEDVPGPDAAERYLILQTLAGAWPIEEDRLVAYLEKALREAKRTTSWVEPDEAHEAEVFRFARELLQNRAFLADFEPVAAELARLGERAGLAQLLLKLTVPGVPDIYQGDELLSLSLVDPDNRRPVDWDRRRELLDALRAGAPGSAAAATGGPDPAGAAGGPDPADAAGGPDSAGAAGGRDSAGAAGEGVRKLWLIVRALELRARRPEAFEGDYAPLAAPGGVVAFARGDAVVAAAAVRPGAEGAVELPAGRWRDVLAEGPPLEGSAPLGALGIALLERA
jgi:(1->4)-alpha-D-glucan 1-alpha-D-glucosylmutase